MKIQRSIGHWGRGLAAGAGIAVFAASPVLAQNGGGGAPAAPAPTGQPEGGDAKRVYFIEMKGKFAEDIAEAPLRDAIKDAKAQKADYVIIVLDNDWSEGPADSKLTEDATAGKFEELTRAEAMAKVVKEDVQREWQTPPRIVFWVKQAMGGAAFLPLVSDTIYFSKDGRMGGIGNLELNYGTTGDEVVRQKMFSLWVGHAEGLAIQGGYEPRLVRAMARIRYVLSVKYNAGRPEYLERMPEGPDEFLLTDDGTDSRQDSIVELARGEGTDVLTLNAELARNLRVSQGTVNTRDELLSALGLARDYQLVDKRSNQITEQWSRGIGDAKRALKRLFKEYSEVQVKPPGDYNARSAARGEKRRKLQDMLGIYGRYGDGISYEWRGQNGVPSEVWLKDALEVLRVEQIRDKK